MCVCLVDITSYINNFKLQRMSKVQSESDKSKKFFEDYLVNFLKQMVNTLLCYLQSIFILKIYNN